MNHELRLKGAAGFKLLDSILFRQLAFEVLVVRKSIPRFDAGIWRPGHRPETHIGETTQLDSYAMACMGVVDADFFGSKSMENQSIVVVDVFVQMNRFAILYKVFLYLPAELEGGTQQQSVKIFLIAERTEIPGVRPKRNTWAGPDLRSLPGS